jgi:hypothetical protein
MARCNVLSVDHLTLLKLGDDEGILVTKVKIGLCKSVARSRSASTHWRLHVIASLLVSEDRYDPPPHCLRLSRNNGFQ